MIRQIQKYLRGDYLQRDLRAYDWQLDLIRKREIELGTKSDLELKQLSKNLRIAPGDLSNDQKQIEAYALACEVSYRLLGMRPFDVQVIAALAIYNNSVIEMETGEGKTLVATMPAYFHAITMGNVHIHTFNDYLARRDAQWIGPVFEFLGLSVGFIQEEQTAELRKDVYKNDIVYLTAKEGGFDYLRNFLANDKSEIVLDNTSFAIIDEVDSILIDEARIPLVIAGSGTHDHTEGLYEIARIVRTLTRKNEFDTDELNLNIFLTDEGIKVMEKKLSCPDLYAIENNIKLTKVNLALQAAYLLDRDIDYIVRDGVVELVDEFTGRVMDNRKWPHGLQAAIEAKEGLEIQEEGIIRGKTTLQHFFKIYSKLGGMTGTASAAAEEFMDFYNLEVVAIPSNLPSKRVDQKDRIFLTKELKMEGVVTEIKNAHELGRPVLVGTATIEESEVLGDRLKQENIVCDILNAKNDEEEAAIIADAGKLGAVTISTNMAGRGTDIKLGGRNEENKEQILALGGLYVIGTNRFESNRIDYQLRGRAGRQGDEGSSRFFVSLEDDLMKKHGIDELIPKRFHKKNTVSETNSAIVRREVDRVQRISEGKNYEIRATLRKYTELVEMQRKIVHQQRQDILDNNFPSLLKDKDPALYNDLVGNFGETVISNVEKQISLFVCDRCWSEYLEEADQVRQGIYLVTLGGLNPLREFQKAMDENFAQLTQRIDDEIMNRIKNAKISESGIDMEKEGMKLPTSTWTYLVNDNPFGDRLETILGGQGNVGFAAFAGVFWYLLALYYIAKRWFENDKS